MVTPVTIATETAAPDEQDVLDRALPDHRQIRDDELNRLQSSPLANR